MDLNIFLFLFFANFLHFSTGLYSENSLSFAEFPIFNLSSNIPNLIPNFTQIQFFSLQNDKFLVSWFNQLTSPGNSSFPGKNEIIRQIYDANETMSTPQLF